MMLKARRCPAERLIIDYCPSLLLARLEFHLVPKFNSRIPLSYSICFHSLLWSIRQLFRWVGPILIFLNEMTAKDFRHSNQSSQYSRAVGKLVSRNPENFMILLQPSLLLSQYSSANHKKIKLAQTMLLHDFLDLYLNV